MTKGLVNESSLNSIGSAINVLNGTEGTYMPSEMGEAIIDAISTETANGNPIHITDAAACYAVSCVTTLEPVQEGSGDPSPENVRPITGHTGMELTRTGKNLFDGYIEQGGINTSTGQTTNSNIRLRTRFIKVLPNTIYSISTNLKIRAVCEYDNNSNYLSTLIDNAPGLIAATITTSANATYIRFVMKIGSSTPITPDDFEWGQIELGSTATAYEPYRGETHSVAFPQAQSPVYGCKVDWVNGVLRVTKAYIDLGTKTYTRSQNVPRFYFQSTALDNMKPAPSSAIAGNIICSQYATYSQNELFAGTIGISVDSSALPWINIYDPQFANATVTEFKTAMSGVQLVYELATPLEIPLTPQIITLLKGENNVWTDAGTSEIEYTVDLQAYIQKLINEASTTVYEETWSSQGLTYTLTSDGTLKITATNDVFIGHPDIIRNIIYCIKRVDATDTHIQGTAQDEGFMYFVDDAIPSKSLSIQFDFSPSFYYIRNNAFRNAPITSFAIPSTVRFIGGLAFNNSKLTSIAIPASVEEVGQGAFGKCASLQTATIAESNQAYDIYQETFEQCTALTTVLIQNKATKINRYAFYKCTALTSVTLPSTVTEIGDYAFQQCSALPTISIPNVTSIGYQAFMDCTALTSIDISLVEEVGYEAFYGCNNLVETVGTPNVFTIPDTLTTTRGDFLCLRNGQTAHLTNVVIGTGLTTTTEWMFGRQTALQSVTFKGVMTSIHNNTFINCTQQGLTINFPNMTEAQVQALSGYSSKWGATNATIVCSDTV